MYKMDFVDKTADSVAEKHLTSADRKKIPAKKFAGPNRSFPIENKAHARAAIMDSKYAADPAAIKAKAEAVLRK